MSEYVLREGVLVKLEVPNALPVPQGWDHREGAARLGERAVREVVQEHLRFEGSPSVQRAIAAGRPVQAWKEARRLDQPTAAPTWAALRTRVRRELSSLRAA